MTESDLEELLSRPGPAETDLFGRLPGDLLVIGASGKMGPSLVRLARRTALSSGRKRRIIAAARFSDVALAPVLDGEGIETVQVDLAEPGAVDRLPDAELVIFMVGRKFGTGEDHSSTWAANTLVAGDVVRRFRHSRLVVFSTGSVYPLTPVAGGGSVENDPMEPAGEYGQSALARERLVEFGSRRWGTPAAILRINYAVEPRYGVLRDIADLVWNDQPVDLAMGYVNVIWQRDANAAALHALELCSTPPLVLNVTGPDTLRVRDLAFRFGDLLDRTPRFTGTESDTALLSNASRLMEILKPGLVTIEEMTGLVAGWVAGGGRGLGKPTRFQEREGKF